MFKPKVRNEVSIGSDLWVVTLELTKRTLNGFTASGSTNPLGQWSFSEYSQLPKSSSDRFTEEAPNIFRQKTAKGRCSTRQFPSKVVVPQQFAQLHSSKCLCLWTWEWLITYIHGFAVYRALSKLLAHVWDGIFHSKKRPSPQWPSQPKPVQDWLGSLDLSLPGGDLVIGWSLVGSYLPIRPS